MFWQHDHRPTLAFPVSDFTLPTENLQGFIVLARISHELSLQAGDTPVLLSYQSGIRAAYRSYMVSSQWPATVS